MYIAACTNCGRIAEKGSPCPECGNTLQRIPTAEDIAQDNARAAAQTCDATSITRVPKAAPPRP